MFVNVHDENRRHQSQEVCDESCVEIQAGFSLETAVEAEKESDKYSRNNDVAKSKHRKVWGWKAICEQILRKDEFDRGFKAFGDSDHDVSSKHPEDIVDEETAEQNASGDDVVEMKQLDTIDGERQPEKIVGDPVLLE